MAIRGVRRCMFTRKLGYTDFAVFLCALPQEMTYLCVCVFLCVNVYKTSVLNAMIRATFLLWSVCACVCVSVCV